MFSRLQTKIILIPFLILFLSANGNLMLSRRVFESEYLKVVKEEVSVIGKTLDLQLESLLDLGLPLDDIIGFEEILADTITEYPDVTYAAIVDDRGTILFHSDIRKHGHRIQVPEILTAIASRADAVVDYVEESDKYYGFVTPVSDNKDKNVGAVLLGLPAAIIAERVASATKSSTFISLASFVISLALITLTLSTWVIKPLTQLSKATKDIVARGTESFKPVNIHSKDEIGRLADSFNTMASQLQKTTVSKAYVDSIISNMTDALIVVDSQGRVQTVNKAASELLECPTDELLQQPVTSVLGSLKGSPFHRDGMKALLRDGELKNVEAAYTTRTGRKISVLLSCSVVRNEDSSIKYVVCTAKDITDLKQAEEALKLQTERLTQSNAQLQQFAYVASHDLQEPLRKVVAFGNRLQEKYGSSLDEQANDYLSRMVGASERMQKLVEGLLEYSRISTAKQPLALVDLNKTASEVLSDLELQIEQTGAKVQVKQLPVVEAEPMQMRRLFQNLIGNALKFHPPGVTPEIRVFSQPASAGQAPRLGRSSTPMQEIYIKDNGIGIAKEYSERIFGIFQRLHGRAYEGTGMGLAICRKIVEEHGGSIRVESSPGEGSTFIVTLPERQPKDLGVS